MKFAHLADTHLGYRQYGLIEREEDFYNAFEDIINKIIEENPDFLIHSGDLFEFSKPSPNALLIFQEQFLKLKDNGIPVYAIAGNHDILMRKNAIPPQVLFKKLGLNLISPKNPYFIYDDVFIGGCPYHSKLQVDSLKNSLNHLSKEAENYSKKILVIHQGIDKYLPWEYELEIADIPQNFDYYACGHVHTRIIDDFGGGKLAYSGSLEIWKANELGDYVKKNKGFYSVEMSNDSVKVEPVNIELQREFIIKNIQYSQFDDEIQELQSYILKLNAKPIVNLTVEGGNFNRGDVYEKVNTELFDISLKIRPVFKSEDILNDEKLIENIATLDPKELLAEKLEVFDNEDIVKLAIELLNNLSNDKLEESEKISNKFFKEYFEDLDISEIEFDDFEIEEANLFSYDDESKNSPDKDLNNFTDVDNDIIEKRNNDQT
ncbi:MAG: DNA repair exonuclease [Methanobacteriaceae archaeon]|jgi:DNA repair exonuclease SbcCD nuclease subunit|nr:DNA repair exonuclease [Candidatus Methanorudis spinitermitis]